MKILTPLFLLLVLSAPLPVQAVGANAQFVSELESIQPGVPFTVALHILPDKHYHTYWKYPGIVGLPTSIKWQLPKGFRAGEIAWPAPQEDHMAGPPAHGNPPPPRPAIPFAGSSAKLTTLHPPP